MVSKEAFCVVPAVGPSSQFTRVAIAQLVDVFGRRVQVDVATVLTCSKDGLQKDDTHFAGEPRTQKESDPHCESQQRKNRPYPTAVLRVIEVVVVD